MRKLHSCLAVVILMAAACSATADDYEFGGHFKSFLLAGDTVLDEPYYLLIHRLRLQFEYYPVRSFELHAEIDNTFRWGSYYDTDIAALADRFANENYVDLEVDPLSNDDLRWRMAAHRLYARFTNAQADVTVGRQRIAWGTGRIWNPTDLFNPVNPTQFEPGEIPGADGVHLAIRPTDSTQMEAAFAIGRDDADTRWAVRSRVTVGSYDISAMAGRFRDKTIVGADYTGYLGDGGFRGEFAWSDDGVREYLQAVIGYDYIFSGVSLLAEYLYNGGNIESFDPTDFDAFGDYDAIVTLGRHYLAIQSGGELHPLVSLRVLGILDIEGPSAFLFPSISYNWFQNVDLNIGVQLFFGDEGDYSLQSHTAVIFLGWYF